MTERQDDTTKKLSDQMTLEEKFHARLVADEMLRLSTLGWQNMTEEERRRHELPYFPHMDHVQENLRVHHDARRAFEGDQDALFTGLVSEMMKMEGEPDKKALTFLGFVLALFLMKRTESSGAPQLQLDNATSHPAIDAPPAPPKSWEFALFLLLSKADRENIIGDLAEEYIEVANKFGSRRANLWYYKQVVGSTAPVVWKAVKAGWFVALGEWLRRHIS